MVIHLPVLEAVQSQKWRVGSPIHGFRRAITIALVFTGIGLRDPYTSSNVIKIVRRMSCSLSAPSPSEYPQGITTESSVGVVQSIRASMVATT